MKTLSRRNFLVASSALASTSLVTGKLNAEASTIAPKRIIRIAHLTDIHVMPGRNSQAGMAKAFQHAQSLADKPDFIFNGGDCIMDALKRSKDETQAQWTEWRGVLKNELDLPMHSAIGNHDVWGWANPDRLSNEDYGKKWAMEELSLEKRYYSFKQAGWCFIVLDSTYFAPSNAKGYTAKLDEKQFEWLTSELQSINSETPICILSHIPIISFCPFFDGDNEKNGNWEVPGPWMHIDARRIKDLFSMHDNIKTCLSGHIHLQDEVQYLGIKYLCNGAVSGGWWEGNYQEFPPAYVLVDLYDDGSVQSFYTPYM
ncbi:metallophosphoesterase [Puniceicoccaceae bacterium K14]|nr:metallophosphoesterase [Puniceicoccaceae bacterium K14]